MHSFLHMHADACATHACRPWLGLGDVRHGWQVAKLITCTHRHISLWQVTGQLCILLQGLPILGERRAAKMLALAFSLTVLGPTSGHMVQLLASPGLLLAKISAC